MWRNALKWILDEKSVNNQCTHTSSWIKTMIFWCDMKWTRRNFQLCPALILFFLSSGNESNQMFDWKNNQKKVEMKSRFRKKKCKDFFCKRKSAFRLILEEFIQWPKGKKRIHSDQKKSCFQMCLCYQSIFDSHKIIVLYCEKKE